MFVELRRLTKALPKRTEDKDDTMRTGRVRKLLNPSSTYSRYYTTVGEGPTKASVNTPPPHNIQILSIRLICYNTYLLIIVIHKTIYNLKSIKGETVYDVSVSNPSKKDHVTPEPLKYWIKMK